MLVPSAPEVEWAPAGHDDWEVVIDRQPIGPSDRVRTGPGASARLVYSPDASTDLGASAGVLIRGLEWDPDGALVVRLYQAAGAAVHRAGPAGRVVLAVETPSAAARVRDATLAVDVAPEGTTRLAAGLAGSDQAVSVWSPGGAGAPVALLPGQEITLPPAPGAVTPPPLVPPLPPSARPEPGPAAPLPPPLLPPAGALARPAPPAPAPAASAGAPTALATSVPAAAPSGPAVAPSPAPMPAPPPPPDRGAVAPQAPGPPGPRLAHPQVTWAAKHDTSPPLRALARPARPAAPPRDVEVPRGRRPVPPAAAAPARPARDPALQAPGREPLFPMLAPSQNFDGLSNADNLATINARPVPPDPNGDVGPNHYVQMTNLIFAVYNKTGTRVFGPAATNSLWSGFGGVCETTNQGDPIVLYDRQADRWLLSQFAFAVDSNNVPVGPFFECVAVSQTSDPTGSYHRYAFQISATKLNDYPKLGVWPDAYYASFNQFVFSPSEQFAGVGVAAFERDKMLNGQSARMVYFDLAASQPNSFGMLPSHLNGAMLPPAGAPNYFVEQQDTIFGFPTDRLQVFEFRVNWADPAASSFTGPTVLNTAPFDSNLCLFSASCIPQRDTAQRLDPISTVLMHRLNYRNFGAYEVLVANHTVDVDGTDHAGIRWYELRKSGGGGWTIYQQGTFAPDSHHRWMGSINMDKYGNIALGYSVSSSSLFPSIRYAGRLALDPLGTLPVAETTLQAGGGSQTASSRWGDYSSLSVDPTDDCTFWYTQEYYPASSDRNWSTRIGAFRFPGCPPPLATCPPGSAATRPRVVLSVVPGQPGRLQVTVSASTTTGLSTNQISQISFGTATNGLIDIPGGVTGSPGNFTLDLTPAQTSFSFTIRRATAGAATTVPFTVFDVCGAWPTFAGGGPNAF
jgi:hypothetical protein